MLRSRSGCPTGSPSCRLSSGDAFHTFIFYGIRFLFPRMRRLARPVAGRTPMTAARSWAAVDLGGPEALRCLDSEVPDPRAREVTIGVWAVGMNPVDAKHIAAGQDCGLLPLAIGYEVAGFVTTVGPDAEQTSGARAGDMVLPHGAAGAPGVSVQQPAISGSAWSARRASRTSSSSGGMAGHRWSTDRACSTGCGATAPGGFAAPDTVGGDESADVSLARRAWVRAPSHAGRSGRVRRIREGARAGRETLPIHGQGATRAPWLPRQPPPPRER
jgi:hypothetical protein